MHPAAADDDSASPTSGPAPPEPDVNPAILLHAEISAPTDEITVLAVAGEVDQVTTPVLHRTCETALGLGRRHLIVDFSAVTFMSSAGINLMVKLRRDYAEPQGLHLVLPPTVARLWNLLGITDLFAVYPTRAAALAAITRS